MEFNKALHAMVCEGKEVRRHYWRTNYRIQFSLNIGIVDNERLSYIVSREDIMSNDWEIFENEVYVIDDKEEIKLYNFVDGKDYDVFLASGRKTIARFRKDLDEEKKEIFYRAIFSTLTNYHLGSILYKANGEEIEGDKVRCEDRTIVSVRKR